MLPAIFGPLDGGVIDTITFLGKLNEYPELDRSGMESLQRFIKEVIGRFSGGGVSLKVKQRDHRTTKIQLQGVSAATRRILTILFDSSTIVGGATTRGRWYDQAVQPLWRRYGRYRMVPEIGTELSPRLFAQGFGQSRP